MSPPTDELAVRVAAEVRRLAGPGAGDRDLAQALRLLAKWRAAWLERALLRRLPKQIPAGPFAGMAYGVRASEGARLARLLGVYESSLIPVIEAMVARRYSVVVDIGAAEGYYAVGLALRMPGARILAHDGDPRARALCAELAAANGVADRVRIGGVLTHADFATLPPGDCAILCDIEGAEAELLDPEAAPALLGADLLVEVHEGMKPGTLDLLRRRFEATHDIRQIGRQLADDALPDWAERLSDMDRLLLLWEWRASPTPWLWMTRK